MGAPKGNQFWKLRSKHGRDKLFASPEKLWEAACEYFEWCDNNPIIKEETLTNHNEGGYTKEIKCRIPYTIEGFCLYCDTSARWLRDFESNDSNKDFFPIITRIRETIYSQKFSGAAAGIFNSNIIARDLGLTDKTDNNISGGLTNTIINLGEGKPDEATE